MNVVWSLCLTSFKIILKASYFEFSFRSQKLLTHLRPFPSAISQVILLCSHLSNRSTKHHPYTDQQLRLKNMSVLGSLIDSQELLDCVRQPSNERILPNDTYWLHNFYEPSFKGSWAEIQKSR